jgi:hypothetical protein
MLICILPFLFGFVCASFPCIVEFACTEQTAHTDGEKPLKNTTSLKK